ncbi:hypothetical protein Sjap_015062 [Stephania japonica]|uniref:Uncharacterized protein n=1 Tax=Stephania japonica TaxID=461633 RepID=A0AAP0IJ74_9MAGN
MAQVVVISVHAITEERWDVMLNERKPFYSFDLDSVNDIPIIGFPSRTLAFANPCD